MDREHILTAQRWSVREVQHFMIVFGLLSSVFDLLTFGLLLWVFHADESTFRTTWFLVSLLTELAVVLVLRTAKPAWQSAPSTLLLGTTVAVAALACSLPYIGPVARLFGLVALPWTLMACAMLIVVAYMLSTEAIKRWFYARPPV